MLFFTQLLDDYRNMTDLEQCTYIMPNAPNNIRTQRNPQVHSSGFHVVDWHYFLDREIREQDST